MRFGMSWRAGPGRREWISMGPLGWLILGLPLLAVFLIYWTLIAIVYLFVWSARGIAALTRR